MTVAIISANAASSSPLLPSRQSLTQLDTVDELRLTVRRTFTAVGGDADVTSGCTGQVDPFPPVALTQLDMPVTRLSESELFVFDASVSGGSAEFLAAIGQSTARLACTVSGTDDQGLVVTASAQVPVTPDDVQVVQVPGGGTPTAPGFSKAFAPEPTAAGGANSLTFTIDNTVNEVEVTALDFTDTLPTGMSVAPEPRATTSCAGGTLTAAPDAGTISYTDGTVGTGASCMVKVDVTGAAAGTYVNTTGDLTSSAGNSGPATDMLVVGPSPTPTALSFIKEFTDDPVVADGTVTLEFTLGNGDTASGVSDISFTDDLDAVAPGLIAVDLPKPDVCGPGSLLTGTSVLSLTDASLPPDERCVFSVTLQAPATTGTFSNRTSDLLVGGQPGASPATDDLLILADTAPTVTITTPADGLVVAYATSLTFMATAIDDLEGDLSAQIEWESTLDGSLGTGAGITGMLSIGMHTITARVADGGGLVGVASITVTVSPP